MSACRIEILLSQAGQTVLKVTMNCLRVVFLAMAVFIDTANEPGHVRQFESALYHAVAGENLLYQSRAGAWQADDKDRREVGITTAGIGVKKFGVEGLNDAIVNDLCLHRIVLFCLSAKGIAFFIALKSGFELAVVLFRFAEREIKVDPGFIEQLVVVNKTFHLGDFIIRESKSLQVRQAPIGFAESRVALYTGAITVDGFFLQTDRFLGVSQGGQGATMVGLFL